ncbi:glycoside hydrolase [Aequorivita sp. F47161]|uniref:Glycoside hydrolase n=1 Tax=Aequorivita vitellina TaxID=2874475 RepID=A0A9X1QUZ9_9FLAO|nr:glycoside hydrolase [Aequorivita vitellina]MCG2419245.1 glycoside hydrolase [Aequorivita vitellina]
MTKRYTFLACILIFSLLSSCAQKKESPKMNVQKVKGISKINGVSLVASRDTLFQQNVEPLNELGANYVAIMPFGFIKNLGHPEIFYNQPRQWFGESVQGVAQYVKLLHENEINIMLKPQIWVSRGEFTGLVEMASEEEWLQLEETYRNFIMDFANVAEAENVAIFCIGTELEKFIEHRPEYWRTLINEVKNVYKGKLTYAANWDEYKRVPFWDALDFIGVDAYFPVSESKTPTIDEVKMGWERWKTELKAISEKENKKILFAEYGYRSVDFSGKEPWKSDREMNAINLEAQSNSLDGLYQTLWNEEWFAGGFLWKWFIVHERAGGEVDTQFSPQNKPAQTVIAKYYSANKY